MLSMVFNWVRDGGACLGVGMFDVIWVIFGPLLAETCSYFLLLNTIINQYYRSCGFMTSLLVFSTHNGDDTPPNYALMTFPFVIVHRCFKK